MKLHDRWNTDVAFEDFDDPITGKPPYHRQRQLLAPAPSGSKLTSALQAAGVVVAYLTMRPCCCPPLQFSSSHGEHSISFLLTVDVEERMQC